MDVNGGNTAQDREQPEMASAPKNKWEKPAIADFKIAAVTRGAGGNPGDFGNNLT